MVMRIISEQLRVAYFGTVPPVSDGFKIRFSRYGMDLSIPKKDKKTWICSKSLEKVRNIVPNW